MNLHCICTDKVNPNCTLYKPGGTPTPQCVCKVHSFVVTCPRASEKEVQAAIWTEKVNKQLRTHARQVRKLEIKAARALAKHSLKFI